VSAIQIIINCEHISKHAKPVVNILVQDVRVFFFFFQEPFSIVKLHDRTGFARQTTATADLAAQFTIIMLVSDLLIWR
jgi:hypothetical protein